MLWILLSAVFMTTADNSIVNVAVPSIGARLDAGPGELELVVSGYILAYAVLLVTGARLGGMLGYRRAFLAGLALFTLASLACGTAPAAEELIAARVLQGVGATVMVRQVLTGMQLSFVGAERARALALYPAALAGGAAVGQVLGGALITLDILGSGWRSLYSGLAPLAWVVGFGLSRAVLRRLPAGHAAPAGFVLLATAFAGIALDGLVTDPAGAPLVALLGARGVGMGVGFSSLIGHVTAVVEPDLASDLSGILSTNSELAAALGVAAFGTLYLGLAPSGAVAAFTWVTAGLATSALVAAAASHRATSPSAAVRGRPCVSGPGAGAGSA
jgi:MFS family permease